MGFAAKILADSISPNGFRITTWEATFPRIILAEVNTHCMLSRNSASSRAIPVLKRIAAIEEDPFIPEVFGRNQKGMQPGAALDDAAARHARALWEHGAHEAIERARALAELEVHKQYANRLLEPYAWHTAVITATDVDNLFNLRVNPLAQGEFQRIAEMMKKARDESEPRSINYGDWHLPYVDPSEAWDLDVQGIESWKVSAGRCARVSYLTQNGVRDPKEDVGLAEKLDQNGHMSPLEHVARPMDAFELDAVESWDVSFDDGPIIRVAPEMFEAVGFRRQVGTKIGNRTITYIRGPLHYAGKLNGWISRRQFVRGEHDILGHRRST